MDRGGEGKGRECKLIGREWIGEEERGVMEGQEEKGFGLRLRPPPSLNNQGTVFCFRFCFSLAVAMAGGRVTSFVRGVENLNSAQQE